MAFAANGRVIAVEVGGAAVEERPKLGGVHHHYMLVSSAFTACIAVFDDGVALRLHHARESQGFAGEGAVAIGGGVLGVEDADEV